MASVASFSTANPGNGSSITVTKPSGLTVGDLMIFHYSYSDATDTASTISGWTHEINNYGGTLKTGIQYKIADSSDVAASDFTMGFTGIVSGPLAGLLRVTDFVTAGLFNQAEDVGANSDQTLALSVTPEYTNNLLLFFIANNEGIGISSYSVATDNPTWTEQYDIATANTSLAVASATRTQITATGDASFSYSSGSGTVDAYGIMFAIETPSSVTVSIDAPGILTLNGNEPDFVLGNVFSIDAPGILTLSQAEPTIETGTTDVWTPTTKPTDSIWTPTDK
jgi:hypothetical protein